MHWRCCGRILRLAGRVRGVGVQSESGPGHSTVEYGDALTVQDRALESLAGGPSLPGLSPPGETRAAARAGQPGAHQTPSHPFRSSRPSSTSSSAGSASTCHTMTASSPSSRTTSPHPAPSGHTRRQQPPFSAGQGGALRKREGRRMILHLSDREGRGVGL